MDNVAEKSTADALAPHDYCNSVAPVDMETSAAKNSRPLPETPTKPSNDPKKMKLRESTMKDSEVTNATILAAINNLSAMLQEMNVQLKENTSNIAEVTKAVEFNAKEIEECKSENVAVKNKMANLEKENAALRDKVLELARYKRRWNLKLRGLKENGDEDTRERVLRIITQIVPHWSEKISFVIDSVHRLGQKKDDKHRNIIIQFTMRHFRDELWSLSKGSPVCSKLKIKFAEHLLPEDMKAREAVWPQIKAARDAGQRGYFKGPIGYIDGVAIETI